MPADTPTPTAGHTPGPWETGAHPANPKWNSVKPICWPTHSGVTPECEGGRVYFKNPHDARLIAAAPELLEACKKADAWFRSQGDNDEHAMAVRAALSLAQPEGGAG